MDEYRLMIEPIMVGGGKRIFPEDGRARPLELVSATTAGTGVLICTYRPARASTGLRPSSSSGSSAVTPGPAVASSTMWPSGSRR